MLKDLSLHKEIIINKKDTGNSVLILNKCDYIKRMNEMLLDINKFKKTECQTWEGTYINIKT